jgi:hypothetical protein
MPRKLHNSLSLHISLINTIKPSVCQSNVSIIFVDIIVLFVVDDDNDDDDVVIVDVVYDDDDIDDDDIDDDELIRLVPGVCGAKYPPGVAGEYA